MAYSITKKTRTSRIKYYNEESENKSKSYKLGLAKGLHVGSEGLERQYLEEQIRKNKEDKIKTYR